MDIRPKVKPKQVKQIKENIGYNLCNLSIVRDFFRQKYKTLIIKKKTDKLDFLNIKSFII